MTYPTKMCPRCNGRRPVVGVFYVIARAALLAERDDGTLVFEATEELNDIPRPALECATCGTTIPMKPGSKFELQDVEVPS